MMKTKKFDCVEMKHELQENLYNSINPKSFDEYFDKLTQKREHSELFQSIKMKKKVVTGF